MTPEEKREFTIARINSFLFDLKHMHGNATLAKAYARALEYVCIKQGKASYHRFIRNLILFLADLKGQYTDKKDVVDEMIADLIQSGGGVLGKEKKRTPGEPMSIKQKIKDYILEHALGIVALIISITALIVR